MQHFTESRILGSSACIHWFRVAPAVMHRTTHEIGAVLCYCMDILGVYSERHGESNRSEIQN